MRILFIVECREGEESMWLSEIDTQELNLITPLLEVIKNNQGYFPTGSYISQEGPKVEELYGWVEGFSIINRFLPTPIHGFSKINEVLLFQEPLSYKLC